MTLLQVMPATDGNDIRLRTTDEDRIRVELSRWNIVFERWATTRPLDAAADSGQVLEAYRDDVRRISEAGGYRLVDVVRMRPDDADPDWPATARAAREKFLEEHVHDEDEVRFFVEGRGCFYLNLDGMVHAVVCEAGDLLSVPRGTRHWFDMGRQPQFTAIRFFQEEDGWIADFTGEPTARQIPYLDELIGANW
ncbi:cupin domain-containing protein [Micromonospora sp. NPDC048947]|uniref:1,2-dihydroxy-3-keto-5-methylthiopentene dioxygenase n=1 Tax=Micromonospora sp. NPDC048947 TaxID=3154826 RepID=UPI0033DD5A46